MYIIYIYNLYFHHIHIDRYIRINRSYQTLSISTLLKSCDSLSPHRVLFTSCRSLSSFTNSTIFAFAQYSTRFPNSTFHVRFAILESVTTPAPRQTPLIYFLSRSVVGGLNFIKKKKRKKLTRRLCHQIASHRDRELNSRRLQSDFQQRREAAGKGGGGGGWILAVSVGSSWKINPRPRVQSSRFHG